MPRVNENFERARKLSFDPVDFRNENETQKGKSRAERRERRYEQTRDSDAAVSSCPPDLGENSSFREGILVGSLGREGEKLT